MPRSAPKPPPNFALIRSLQKLGYKRIVGVDEVGRGALAGPLIVAAVELPNKVDGITDSKLLSPNQRVGLAKQISQLAVQNQFGQANVEEIDNLGLAAALQLAYRRALAGIEADLILTDFIRLPGFKYISQPQGDRYFYSTAAASIVAKVHRDNLMCQFHNQFPHYGWRTNVGYGTIFHRRALLIHGPTKLHRQSFIKQPD